jgi:hypothetical protein
MRESSFRALLGVLLATAVSIACSADVTEIRSESCILRFNGACDEGTLCDKGTDRADCISGPYRACHTRVSTFGEANCESFEFCGVALTSFPIVESVCSAPCVTVADCPPASEDGLDYACVPFVAQDKGALALPVNAISGCVISCDDDQDCVEGMICGAKGYCVWSSQG